MPKYNRKKYDEPETGKKPPVNECRNRLKIPEDNKDDDKDRVVRPKARQGQLDRMEKQVENLLQIVSGMDARMADMERQMEKMKMESGPDWTKLPSWTQTPAPQTPAYPVDPAYPPHPNLPEHSPRWYWDYPPPWPYPNRVWGDGPTCRDLNGTPNWIPCHDPNSSGTPLPKPS